MDKKQINIVIKELMKKNGFKNTGDFYYKHINENFVIIDFSIVESIQTYVAYKKYSYDDINWKLHNLEELSSKNDSQRVLGAHRIPALTYKKYNDEYTDEENMLSVLSSRIDQIVSYDLPAIEIANINLSIINGTYSNKMKCIALLDLGRITDAISLANKCIDNGEDGGELFWGKTFFQLVVDAYSNKVPSEDNRVSIKNEETFITPSCEIYDSVDWHYDSAQKVYSETFGEFNLDFVDINRIASAHIVYFLTWLIMNDALETTITKELYNRIANIKSRIESPTDVFLDYFDGKLLRSDINPKHICFVDNYFEGEYIHDYSNMLIGLKEEAYISEFNWERYNKIESVITKRYNLFTVNN